MFYFKNNGADTAFSDIQLSQNQSAERPDGRFCPVYGIPSVNSQTLLNSQLDLLAYVETIRYFSLMPIAGKIR